MSQVSPVVSTQYGPKEWLDLAQTQSSKGQRKAVMVSFARANGLETAELVVSLIKHGELDPYIAAKKMRDMLVAERSRGTASTYLTLLHTFYRYAEIQVKDELFKLRVPPVKSSHSIDPPDISHDDFKAMLLKAPEIHPMLQPFLEFGISTGWRVDEPFNIRVKDTFFGLDYVSGEVHLHTLDESGDDTNKTGQPRFSFLSTEAVGILEQHIGKARLKTDDYLFPIENKRKGQWAYHQFMRTARALDLTHREGYLNKWNFHPHTLRNLNLGIAIEADYPEKWAHQLAGHSTGVQEAYNIRRKMGRKWMEKVEPHLRFLE